MPAIPIIMAVGMAVSAAAAVSQGINQKAVGKYQAKIAQQDANDALRAGAEEEASFRKKARAQWGTNIASVGGSGVSMGGSPLLVMSEVAEETENEAWGIRRNLKFQAGRNIAQSALYKNSGKQAYNQGLLSAGGTLMQGAGSFMGGMGAYKGASSAGSAGSGGASQLLRM